LKPDVTEAVTTAIRAASGSRTVRTVSDLVAIYEQAFSTSTI
jgi:hypothetical protein